MEKLHIIPTPQAVSANRSAGVCPLSRIRTVFCSAELAEAAKEALKFLPPYGRAAAADADLVITTTPDDAAVFPFPFDETWFSSVNAREQGYILKGSADGRILLYAHEPLGIMYGIATLLQLPPIENEFEIKDFPDFRYRGNKWLIWNETEIWSYDFGDGVDAFRKRIVQKLDLCLKYKINMIFFDGWGADIDRTPHYKELMRACNTEARKRGIHLVFGAYTMGYGLASYNFGKHFGKVYKNRRDYPDGDTYECLGTFIHDKDQNGGIPFVTGRDFGTCISNEALMNDKLDELCTFVKEVQPGALYLHNMDSHLIDQRLWLARCDGCRKKWPSDDVLAEDGMAGAFASFFDRLNGALQSVTADGYDAARDLLIFNVSPGYMWYVITDEEVRAANAFWEAVQKYTKVKNNVFPMFREMFTNMDDDRLRIRDVVAKSWQNGQGFSIINFSGGDGFYTDKLFFISSVFNYMFKGADALITCSGNAFQEPLQVFNAEYMWNCENSDFYNITDVPTDYDAFLQLYHDCRDTKIRPAEIYENGGMLDIICEKLYGEHAAVMAKIFKLCGENEECVVPYPCNKETHTAGNDVFVKFRWDNELPPEEIDRLIASFGEMQRLNETALQLLENENADNTDIRAFYEMLSLNQPLIVMWHEYLQFYKEADALLKDGIGDKESLLQHVQAGKERAAEAMRDHKGRNFQFADAMEGALAKREELLEVLEYNHELILRSLNTGKRIPDDRKILVKNAWW